MASSLLYWIYTRLSSVCALEKLRETIQLNRVLVYRLD